MKKIIQLLTILHIFTYCNLIPPVKARSSQFASYLLVALGGVSTSTEGNISTGIITPDGGQLFANDGSFILDIPSGALSETSQITITKDVSPVGNIPEGFSKRTNILKFEPKGLVFKRPARLTISYDQGEMTEAGFEEKSINFYYIKDDSTLEKMKLVSVDYAQNRMIVEVEHFSFGVGLSIQVFLVNSSFITNPVVVLNIANNVIAELSSFASEGYGSVSEYFQAHLSILGPFLNQLVAILGYDPVSLAFPNADFNGNGIPNSEDPYVQSTGPVINLISAGSAFISANLVAVNSTQFVWQSSKSGTFTIRAGATNCSTGIVVASGSVSAGVNNTFGPIYASNVSLGTTSYRVCVVNSGVTGAYVHSLTRDDSNPTVSFNPAGGSFGTVQNVALNCGDSGGAGCLAVAYSTDGTTPAFTSSCSVSAGILYSSPIVTPDTNTTTIRFKSCDGAGNISSLDTQTYTVDSILPTITINSVSPNYVIKASVDADINWKSSRSGNYSVRLGANCISGTLAHGTNVSGEIIADSPMQTVLLADGQFQNGQNNIHFCVNNLINEIGSTSVILTIDGINPSLAVTPESGIYATAQTVASTCSDLNSGCQKLIYTTNGSDPIFDSAGTIVNGNLYTGSLLTPNNASTTYKFQARDIAGNLSSVVAVTYAIGTVPPTSLSYSTSSATYTANVTIPPNNPSITGSGITFTISPDLPIGLTLNPVTGIISGTPTVQQSATHYTITASNVGGLIAATISITVTPPSVPGLGTFSIREISTYHPHEVIPYGTSAALDILNSKFLIVSQHNVNAEKLAIFRCNLDGTNCSYLDISSGQEQNLGQNPTALIDTINSKLLIITISNTYKPSLVRCNLDGSNCVFTDISAEQGDYSAKNSFPLGATIDYANAKLLVVSSNQNNTNKPALFRCNLDGSDCVYRDISAGKGTGSDAKIVIDHLNSKLLVVTSYGLGSRPGLFRCDMDGSNCVFADVSAGAPNTQPGYNPGRNPIPIIDSINSKLLFIARDDWDMKTKVFRCNLDGSSCTFLNLSNLFGVSGSSSAGSVLIDTENSKILVTHGSKPHLFRCNLDLTGCTIKDSSAGYSTLFGTFYSVITPDSKLKLLSLTSIANRAQIVLTSE
ncbi:chitobiase/beta-hexosaminidase C-terminal domain-containing protein [Leptospira vanthielii]|uniref:Chitobiase/beta-hexosaminidase C-terminal domain protein n=1 Tax=Leptospira vanthielii serovar Holland str. Waz Holland = ATCC 700522 TaxID=1218591 RepID=N1VVI8_9LEPT|nr:chitobiase/beta-hexosaminidase C-terminal domain-containing protein [Leptospira vanthielii]EMY67984.1 chitobiase/beta-hexosaminidase C-terminal domain protein [Leptospira vanthielii serovar Holland str. Waz Holland = ATCC 700522]